MSVLLTRQRQIRPNTTNRRPLPKQQPESKELLNLKLQSESVTARVTVRPKKTAKPKQKTSLKQQNPTPKFVAYESSNQTAPELTTQRPKLKFKHFKSRQSGAPVEKRPQPAKLTTNGYQVQQKQLSNESNETKSNQFKSFLNGSASALLSTTVSQRAPKKSEQKEKRSDDFQAEEGEELSTTGWLQARAKLKPKNGAGHNWQKSLPFQNNASSFHAPDRELVAEKLTAPEFVPADGVEEYHASGCACVASFLGLR